MLFIDMIIVNIALFVRRQMSFAYPHHCKHADRGVYNAISSAVLIVSVVL